MLVCVAVDRLYHYILFHDAHGSKVIHDPSFFYKV